MHGLWVNSNNGTLVTHIHLNDGYPHTSYDAIVDTTTNKIKFSYYIE